MRNTKSVVCCNFDFFWSISVSMSQLLWWRFPSHRCCSLILKRESSKHEHCIINTYASCASCCAVFFAFAAAAGLAFSLLHANEKFSIPFARAKIYRMRWRRVGFKWNLQDAYGMWSVNRKCPTFFSRCLKRAKSAYTFSTRKFLISLGCDA